MGLAGSLKTSLYRLTDLGRRARNRVRHGGRAKTAILAFHKNEDRLLEFWFAYHAEIFGAAAIHIFDNGSTDLGVKTRLGEIAQTGATVITRYDDWQSYHNKGQILLGHMRELEREGYNLFVPLDCDEFIAVAETGGPNLDREAIRAEMDRCLGPWTCHVKTSWYNHPADPRLYAETPLRKVFGAFHGVERLGGGYHFVAYPTAESRIGYFHLHARPFADLRAKAAQKVQGHGVGLDRASLAAYVASGDPGHKSARELLMTEADYLATLRGRPYRPVPALDDWFRARFGRGPFDDAQAIGRDG